MADNIKIIGSISETVASSRYDEKDSNLIISRNLQEYFGGQNDYIELYLYDAGENLLYNSYNYLDYKSSPSNGLNPSTSIPPNTTGNIPTENVGITSTLASPTGSTIPLIEIDPIQDIQNVGYSSGEFISKYYFFQNRLSNPTDRALFVKEISSDRTEIRVVSTTLTNDEIEKVANEMIDEINNSTYYVDYLLNFGEDKQYIAVNIFLNPTPEGNEILFKLYQPLPENIQEKDTLWVVSEKTFPYSFSINLDKLVTPPPPPTLRGPNFDIPVSEIGTVSTPYINYQTALSSLQSLQNSSYNQLSNLLATQSIQINVDYVVSESNDFNNFVFFGSAKARLDNFYTKVKQIEDYTTLINIYKPNVATTASLQTEINVLSSSINDTITQFDGYESYLYFESGSYTWPKSGSLKPYSLLSVNSVNAINWFATQSLLAEEYDLNNQNNLIYSVPDFVYEDENNTPYLRFLNMVGHYFDNIWIYLKAITDVNLANNNLNYGISKDLVYEQLKSLGIKVYSSQAGEALDQFLIGSNTGSSLWNNDFSPTSSYLNNIPRKDLVSELYKRIYHNLPLLLKTKGTVAGLDYLMTTFGVPNRTYYTIGSESFYTPTGSSITSSILNVKEYGGSLKKNLIKGYNNDKVRIAPNDIVTGSVLSPIASLQTYTTASSQFRDSDMHYIDISFSPQTQINTYISGAIASNASTWSLDDYIGDPRYLYSSSYVPLDTERTKYYQTGVSGFAPFTASALDYNGFIRLIEFFDNALFKMLGDFVPERISLSTGVTFESPVLERNKSSYARPNTYTGSVYEGEITTSSISSDYGTFYNTLGNDRKAWYDGDISGSYIDVYDYFENSNPNPYLQADSSSFTTQSIYEFEHTDFNVLLNNVSRNVESTNRKRLEYIWGTTGSITSSAELQDSYLTLNSYNNSRYDGSKTYGYRYNTYTSESLIFDSSLNNVSYSFISSSYDWDNIILWLQGNPYYTILYLTGSTNQLATIFSTISQANYIILSNPDPFIPEAVTNKTYKIYRADYYQDPFSNIDYTKLALALSPSLGSFDFNTSTFIPSGESPTITSDYGPGTLDLNFYKEYGGDYSYGKTTSVDRQSYKLGWIRTVPSRSLNFYDKTIFDVKYLIDPNFQITELSSNNNNLFEIQNIFKSGTPVEVSVTNTNFPSNQIKLDGPKTIFRGGFRYDPLLYRENNENLTFTFDNPVTQSTEYIGFKIRGENWYRYGWYRKPGTFTLFFQGPAQSPPGNYYYSTNDPEITNESNITDVQNTSMASVAYTRNQWTGSSGGAYMNFSGTNPLTWGSFGAGVRQPSDPGNNTFIYEFDFLKFPTVIYNEEGSSLTETDTTSFFRVNRSSNNYKIKGQIPVYFYGFDDRAGGAAMFKFVAVIEKSTTTTATEWTPIAVSTLTKIFEQGLSNPSLIASDSGSSAIVFDWKAKGFYQCSFDETGVSLDKDDYLRIRFYFIDYTDIFGDSGGIPFGLSPDYRGVEEFNFLIGGTGQKEGILFTDDKKAYIEIEDINSEYIQYEFTKAYDEGSGSLFSQASANSIRFNPQINSYIDVSIFTPTSNTQLNYTTIVDKFNIQKGDLFRFGPFQQEKPKYYTVSDVFKGVKPPITVSGSFIQLIPALPIFSFFYYSGSQYNPYLFQQGDKITVSGTTSNNYNFTVLLSSYNPTTDIVATWILGSNPVVNESNAIATFTFTNPVYEVFFNRNFDSSTSITPTNFAILRPKQDETSVIIEYKKPPGDVSQTLLIPGDTNQLLKDKTGDIFEYYNPRLNPSTQTQQN
jgi:hypothetical protein